MKKLAPKENLNRNVLSVVCLAGFARVVIEMFRNTANSSDLDFYLDMGYGVIFIATLIALWRRSTHRIIYTTFYIPLVILLCLTLFDKKGLASAVENNIHVALIVIALTLRSAGAMKFSMLLIIGTLISLVFVELEYHFLENYTEYSTSNFNFIFMAIGAIAITFYSKRVFEVRKSKLSEIKEKLSENHAVLKTARARLEAKTHELESLNVELEDKVKERIALLNDRKEATKKYLELTTQELHKEYKGIHELTKEIIGSTKDDMSQMMLDSSQKLDTEINALVLKLNEER